MFPFIAMLPGILNWTLLTLLFWVMNQRFSGVSREFEMRTLARNETKNFKGTCLYIWNSEPSKLFIFWTRICKFQPLLFRCLILKRIPTYKNSHKILKNFEELNLIFFLKAIPSEYQIHKNNILINQNKIMGSNFALSTLLSV